MSSSLRIALDARAASHPQPGGFKTYVEGLIDGLAGLDSPHRFGLYTDRAYPAAQTLPSNFDVTVVPSGPRLIGAGFREQVALPLRMARERADVAHFPCNTAPWRSAGRRVVTVHDLILLRPPGATAAARLSLHHTLMNAYSRLFLIRAARSAHALITASRFSAGEIAARFPGAAGRLHLIPEAAHPDFYPMEPAAAAERVRRELGLEPPYVLALGSADPRKNVGAAIRAFGLLPARLRQGQRLAIALAHPSLQAGLERECAAANVFENAVFLPRPPQAIMPCLYAAARAFVFPSLYEGFGLPPLEAMACGTPVIASNTSSIPEVTGQAALLVDPADTRALAEALGAVLAGAALAAQLRERGLRRAAEFSWRRTAQQTLSVYADAGAGRN